jgi:hypothetical protein
MNSDQDLAVLDGPFFVYANPSDHSLNISSMPLFTICFPVNTGNPYLLINS